MWIDHAWAEDANTLTVVMTDLKNCLDGFSKALLNGQAQNEDRRSQSQWVTQRLEGLLAEQ